jgi:formylglycine-generating enzyme required for sulfatase activity
VNDYSIEVINSVDTSSCIDFSYDFYPCASGYIPIEANLNRGTDYSFCVMSFEAKKVSNTATSQSSGTPWVNVNKTEAMTECSNLSPAGHHLITNEEWMTVAELAESYWGWGDPALPQGVFNHNQAEAVNTSLMYAPFPDVDFDPVPKTHRRKLFLPLGGEIWDLSGNVREWIDGSLPTCASSSSLSVNDYIDMNNTCSNWDTTPLRKLFRPSGNHNNNYNTVGSYNTTHLAAHAIVRGGGFQSDQFNTGIYHIDANVNPANGYSDVGFRCVFKP